MRVAVVLLLFDRLIHHESHCGFVVILQVDSL